MKITTIGPYGFKIDDGDVWFSCDKYFLNSSLFKSLKVGTEIKDIKNNKNGFVKSLIVLTHKDQGEEVIKSQITSLNVCSRNISSECKPSLPFDSIRYAQAVNIAFASVNLGGFVTEEAGIVYAFDRADKIYKEFNVRCSR